MLCLYDFLLSLYLVKFDVLHERQSFIENSYLLLVCNWLNSFQIMEKKYKIVYDDDNVRAIIKTKRALAAGQKIKWRYKNCGRFTATVTEIIEGRGKLVGKPNIEYACDMPI